MTPPYRAGKASRIQVTLEPGWSQWLCQVCRRRLPAGRVRLIIIAGEYRVEICNMCMMQFTNEALRRELHVDH